MRDFADLAVFLATFVAAATVATLLSVPLMEWAAHGQDWQSGIALTWFCACFALAMRAAWLALGAYHRANSVGRSQNS